MDLRVIGSMFCTGTVLFLSACADGESPKENGDRHSGAGKKVEREALNKTEKIAKGADQAFVGSADLDNKGTTIEEIFMNANIPEVVALVGEDKITRDDLVKDIKAQLPPFMKGQPLPPQVAANISYNIKKLIDSIVNRKLLLKLAAEDGITPSPRMLMDQLDSLMAKMSDEEKTEFEGRLEAQGTSIEKEKAQAMNDVNSQEAVAIEHWIETKLTPSVTVADAVAQKYYNEHPEYFKQSETVEVEHILVTPERPDMEALTGMSDEQRKEFMENAEQRAKVKSEELLEKVKGGEDFAALAVSNSKCPSALEGGKLPAFNRKGQTEDASGGRMDQSFTDASFALKELGDVSAQPLKTPYGYHIIRLVKRTEESTVPFEEVKEILISNLKNEELGNVVRARLEAERAKQDVKIFVE